MSSSLETKSRNGGHTPLALAFSLHRFEAAKLLIAAGADQTVRDKTGSNILHLLLCSAYTSYTRDDERYLKQFLDLIDKRLVPSLLMERSSQEPGSLTPLARWIRHASQEANVLKVILDFAAPTENEHLEVLDGSGDTPVHYVVKCQKLEWLKMMLEYRPDLLYRENSVGQTPYELAEDAYIASCVRDQPQGMSNRIGSICDRDAYTFAKDYTKPEVVDAESIWSVCREAVKKNPGMRKLVSLLDANEVANRLAKRYRWGNVYDRSADNESDEGSDDGKAAAADDCTDEVSDWYSAGQFY